MAKLSSKVAVLFVSQREFWLSLKRLYSPQTEFWLSLKKFFLPEGNLGFLERDYYLPPKGEMTLDKVFRSPYGKLNTPSHFDSRTFSGNCKLSSLLTSSYKCEDSCTWFLRLIAIWTYHEKRTHPPVDSIKRLESFHSTWLWQIKEFSGDPVLILSNVRGNYKLSPRNGEQLMRVAEIG